MNLEFQSAGKSTMTGLRGINAKAEIPAANQSRGYERSAQFKDLLNQSKQDLKQADHQLEKVRENRRESKAIAESNRREDDQRSPKDIEVRTEDDQVEEPVMKKLNTDENQDDTALLTCDAAQLMGMQNYQGGIETALTQLNLKSGLEENKMPEDLNVQGQILSLTNMEDPLASTLVSEIVPHLDETGQEEVPVLQPNIGSLENEAVENVEGVLKKSGAELATTDATSDPVDFSELMVNRNGADNDPETQAFNGISQNNGNQAEDLKSENAIGSTDSTEEQITEKTKVFNAQTNTINQTEDQNPEEKGVQEINVMGINTNKGSEVQPDAKVEIAQQVQQKILQNFEPNKPMVLQMTLSPDNLGDIDIKLSYDQGKLIIDITALSQETQNLLGKQINLLVRGLALQNVQVETVHLNTPVEQSSDSQDAAFMMNNGSDANENHNQTLLREKFVNNSRVLNRVLTSSEEDESIVIPQNLQNYTNHKVNYLI